MAAWFTAVKAIWPHLGPIVAAAVPAFTRWQSAGARDPSVLQQQIDELQQAAAQNTIYIKELAEQLRIAVAALEQGTYASEARLRRAYTVAWIALAVAVIALGVAGYLFSTQ